jgi:hypothetical protein
MGKYDANVHGIIMKGVYRVIKSSERISGINPPEIRP